MQRSHEYARKLLQVALQQREQLGNEGLSSDSLTELDNLASIVYTIIEELKLRLSLSKKLFTVYEPTQATVKQLSNLCAHSPTETFVKEMEERKSDIFSSLALCRSEMERERGGGQLRMI